MRSVLSNFVWTLQNLFAGLRLTLPAPVSRRSFHFSGDQALILMVLASGAAIVAQYPFGASASSLSRYAWAVLGAQCFFTLLLCYIVAKIQRAPHSLTALAVAIFSMSVPFQLYVTAFFPVFWPSPLIGADRYIWWLVAGLMLLWLFAATARGMRVVYTSGWRRSLVLAMVFIGGLAAADWITATRLWYAPAPEAAADEPAPHINTERTYYAQAGLTSRALVRLAPSRPGVGELYFIGFAGTSTQDVFMKEARAAQALFDEQFDTRNRSLILVNNPRSIDELPLASVSNLRWALNGVARKMNLDDDILFLFLTSHGSPHLVSVDFPELALNDLEDRVLKRMLDRAGIKWRVVVVSACYSGSFVDALKDDHSLIITAAAEDKTSFGCSSENDFTYFGAAYINTALRRERSFITAFDDAREAITARETRENLVPSEPQIYIGKAMRTKLDQLDRRLAKLPPTAAAVKTQNIE